MPLIILAYFKSLKSAAEVASKTINSFFEELSYRTVFFAATLFLASVFVAIRGLTLYRDITLREIRAVEEYKSRITSREMSAAISAATSSAITAHQEYQVKRERNLNSQKQ